MIIYKNSTKTQTALFWKFLRDMFLIGLTGFGGGSALIPLIEKRVVGKIDTEENFNKDVLIAGITPGAMPVEIASGIGLRSFGLIGMIIGAVMMAFPGAMIAVLLLYFSSKINSDWYYVLLVLSKIISLYILYLIGGYIYRKYAESNSKRQMICIVFVVVFVTCGNNVAKLLRISYIPLFGMPVVWIILSTMFVIITNLNKNHYLITSIPLVILSLGYGGRNIIPNWLMHISETLIIIVIAQYIAKSNIKKGIKLQKCVKLVVSWLLILTVLSIVPLVLYSKESIAFLEKGGLSVILSYGGGDAYLTTAEGLFVGSMITAEAFFGTIVVFANMLPGSILCKVLSEIGFYYGISLDGYLCGVQFALMGFACSIVFSGLTFGCVGFLCDSMDDSNIFVTISKWMNPVICGLLINVMLSILNSIVNLR